MSSDIAIRVKNVTKSYQIYNKPQDRLKQSFWCGRRQYFREFKALNDVSFEVKKGETVGIIGRNGSGKSTLLQIICGTLAPTLGDVEIDGRIAALLELGAGFNPEFSGKENVYMNATILGLSKEEVDARYDDIAAFADIGDFIDQPVKTYSSGMYVRLAFSVNIMVNPEIMVVDEALSVGDMNFQAKCMTALTRIQEAGATVLFVSHDISSVKSLCSRAVYLDNGNMKMAGKAADVTEQYLRVMREGMNEEQRKQTKTAQQFEAENLSDKVSQQEIGKINFRRSPEFDKRVAPSRYGTGEVKVTYVDLLNMYNEPVRQIEFNQKVRVQVFLEAFFGKVFSVNVSVYDEKKNNITGCGFGHVDQPYLQAKPGEKLFVEYAFQLPLQEGPYSIRVNISAPIVEDESAEFIDLVNDAVVFRIERWAKSRIWSQVHQFAQLRVEKLT